MDVRRIEEEVDPDFLSDAHSRTGLAESSDTCESKDCVRFAMRRMRELVVKYKAEKVCHEEMVKMPLVDLKMLEYKERHRLRRPVSFGAYGDERVVGIIARAARMYIDYRELGKIDLYSGCHQIRVYEDEIPDTALRMRYRRYEFMVMPFWVDQYTNNFYGRNESGCLLRRREKVIAYTTRQLEIHLKTDTTHVMELGVVVLPYNARGDVRTLIMEEAHATKYSFCPGMNDEHQRSLGLLLQPEIPDWKWEKERLTMDNEAVARHEVHVLSIPDRDGMYIEAEIGESKMNGLEMEQETTKVVVIKERLKEAKDRQKRVKLIVEIKLLEFSVGDYVMMKVSPWKGVVRFSKKGELAPRLFARLIKEFGFALHRASQAGQSCAETYETEGYDPPQLIVIVGTAGIGIRGMAGRVDAQMAKMSQARYGDHKLIHDMLVQHVAMRELQEMRGRVATLEQERQQYEKLCLNGYTTRTMRNLVLDDLRRIMYMTKNDQKDLILLNYNNMSTQPVLSINTSIHSWSTALISAFTLVATHQLSTSSGKIHYQWELNSGNLSLLAVEK
nr:reverse transcriptase domain-containing protein [Tanacetum cinerariifolium]